MKFNQISTQWAFAVCMAGVLVTELISILIFFRRQEIEVTVLLALGLVVADFWYWVALSPLLLYLARRFPLTRPANGLIHIPVGILISAGSIVVSTVGRKLLDRTGFELIPHMIQRLNYETQLYFVFYLFVAFAVAVAAAQNKLVEARLEQADLRAKEAQLRADLTQLRLDNLSAQLQPHFLFNALHTVSALLERDPDIARSAIKRLSRLLRSALRANGATTQSVAAEIEWMKDFLAFEALRFNREIKTSFEIESAAQRAHIPVMVLQPLVENALKHGVPEDSAPELKISAGVRCGSLEICVQDNGPGWDPGEQIYGDGLRLIEERLRTIYNDAGSLELSNANGGGARAMIVLPFVEGKHD